MIPGRGRLCASELQSHPQPVRQVQHKCAWEDFSVARTGEIDSFRATITPTVRESRTFVETSKSRPTHARLRNRELADEAELVSLSVG